MVAGGISHNARDFLRLSSRFDLIVSTAKLECSAPLEILGLEERHATGKFVKLMTAQHRSAVRNSSQPLLCFTNFFPGQHVLNANERFEKETYCLGWAGGLGAS